MLASRPSSTTGVVAAAVASLLLLGTPSYAASYGQLFPGGTYDTSQSHARAYYPSHPSRSSFTTPNDFSSSHVCINGYRWITRDLDHGWGSPAEDAIPVRC